MKTIRLTLAFDGTAYHGWQMQPGKPTIQGIVQDRIEKITGQPAVLTGSGRTDAGTHAHALVASYQTASKIPPAGLVRALNSTLPEDIRVLSARRVPPDFHARRSARSKTYRYQIYRGRVLPPHLSRDHLHYPYPLNLDLMERGARAFVGEHDFASFAVQSGASISPRGATIRNIFNCALKKMGNRLYFTVEGSGFLHHMVRNMLGTLLELGRGRMTQEEFELLFIRRDRTLAGFTAPAKGLVLLRVRY